jgi:hypothetical protein
MQANLIDRRLDDLIHCGMVGTRRDAMQRLVAQGGYTLQEAVELVAKYKALPRDETRSSTRAD